MIRITVKVLNDHQSLTEQFERDILTLDMENPEFRSMVEKVIKDFNQPVDEVIIKTRMEV